MATAAPEKFRLQFTGAQAGNPSRIKAMTQFFLHVFKEEHAVDLVGAAETITAKLIADNSRTLEDALAAVDGVADNIRDAVRRYWGP